MCTPYAGDGVITSNSLSPGPPAVARPKETSLPDTGSARADGPLAKTTAGIAGGEAEKAMAETKQEALAKRAETEKALAAAREQVAKDEQLLAERKAALESMGAEVCEADPFQTVAFAEVVQRRQNVAAAIEALSARLAKSKAAVVEPAKAFAAADLEFKVFELAELDATLSAKRQSLVERGNAIEAELRAALEEISALSNKRVDLYRAIRPDDRYASEEPGYRMGPAQDLCHMHIGNTERVFQAFGKRLESINRNVRETARDAQRIHQNGAEAVKRENAAFAAANPNLGAPSGVWGSKAGPSIVANSAPEKVVSDWDPLKS